MCRHAIREAESESVRNIYVGKRGKFDLDSQSGTNDEVSGRERGNGWRSTNF